MMTKLKVDQARFLMVLAVCSCGGGGRTQSDARVPDGGALAGLDGMARPLDSAVAPSCGGPGLACCPGNACGDGACCMNGICVVAGLTCPIPGAGGSTGGTTATAGTAGATGSPGGATAGVGGTTSGPGTGGITGTAVMGGTAGTAGKGGSTNLTTGGATGTGGITGGGKGGTGGAAGISGTAGGSAGRGGATGGSTGGASSASTPVGGTSGAGTVLGGQGGGATGGSGGSAGGTGAGCATCSGGDVCTSENTCVKQGTIDSFSTCDLAIDPLEGRLGQWDIRVGSAVTCDYPPCGGISRPAWALMTCAAWMAGSSAITEIPEIYSTMEVGLRPKDDQTTGSMYDACKYNAVEITYDTSHRNLSVLMYAQWNGLAPYGQKSYVALEGSETPVTKTIKFSQFGLKCEFLAGFSFVPWAPRAGFRFSVYSLRFVAAG